MAAFEEDGIAVAVAVAVGIEVEHESVVVFEVGATGGAAEAAGAASVRGFALAVVADVTALGAEGTCGAVLGVGHLRPTEDVEISLKGVQKPVKVQGGKWGRRGVV